MKVIKNFVSIIFKVNQTLCSNDFEKPLEDALSIRNARTRNKMVLSIVKTKIAEDKAEQLRLEKKSDDQVAEIQKLKGDKVSRNFHIF